MSREAQLATLTRRAQWVLDEIAFELPSGQCSQEQREAVAGVLDELAAALRGEPEHPVIDVAGALAHHEH